MKCRHCHSELRDVFVDLGCAPPSNAFLRADDLARPEAHLPLRAFTCGRCRLVQIDDVQGREALFTPDYAYFSSYSTTWLDHARRYVDLACERLQLGAHSRVMEVASNDGYLLQYLAARRIPCVGVEPTANTAEAARARGIETLGEFFGRAFARDFVRSRGRVDLVIANNVLAHVPDINDFVGGLQEVLAPEGVATLEFPHLLRLVRDSQFDTIYHEHFSYLSLGTTSAILASQGLSVWDVEELPTHGGSLRIWAQPAGGPRVPSARVAALLATERDAGMGEAPFYEGFQARVDRIKDDLLLFLIDQKRRGRRVVGYGAAAKANTLLNYAGVRPDLLDYVVDASPHKQGRWLPGSRIPVVAPDRLQQTQPEVVLIFPWNLKDEIAGQISYVRRWGAQLAVAVPRLEML